MPVAISSYLEQNDGIRLDSQRLATFVSGILRFAQDDGQRKKRDRFSASQRRARR